MAGTIVRCSPSTASEPAAARIVVATAAITTSSGPGDGSGNVATEIRGLRQTWLPRRATRLATSVEWSVAATCGLGSQSASSFRAFTLDLPVVGFELDEFQRVVPRVDGEEARPSGDLAVVVAGRDAGPGQEHAKPDDVIDLEARVAPGAGVRGNTAWLAEEMQLLVANGVPDT